MSNNTVSYSRLGTFLECPELYRLRYLEKPSGYTAPLQEPLIKGSLAHACIEEYLKGGDKQTAVEIALADWVVNVCQLPLDVLSSADTKATVDNIDIYDEWEIAPNDTLAPPEAEGINLNLLTDYTLKVGWLLHRASGCYNDKDKIRNQDGSIPKNPLEYPPSQFSKELRELKLETSKLVLDNQATMLNTSFKRMSFANIAAQGVSYIFNFELPQEVKEVAAIEYPLQTQKVYFGEKQDKYWNGFIDTVYTTHSNSVVINDHKTEREKRRPEDVAFDLQLNSYAAVYFEQTNKLPDYIAITHLASNGFIVANTDVDVMNMSMSYLTEIQSEIEAMAERRGVDKEWFKKWPAKYGSPCIRRRNDVIDHICPYLRKCHPDYAGCIEHEIKEFLGE